MEVEALRKFVRRLLAEQEGQQGKSAEAVRSEASSYLYDRLDSAASGIAFAELLGPGQDSLLTRLKESRRGELAKELQPGRLHAFRFLLELLDEPDYRPGLESHADALWEAALEGFRAQDSSSTRDSALQVLTKILEWDRLPEHLKDTSSKVVFLAELLRRIADREKPSDGLKGSILDALSTMLERHRPLLESNRATSPRESLGPWLRSASRGVLAKAKSKTSTGGALHGLVASAALLEDGHDKEQNCQEAYQLIDTMLREGSLAPTKAALSALAAYTGLFHSHILTRPSELKGCLVNLLGHQNKGVKELAAAALPRVLQEVSVGLEDGIGSEDLYREMMRESRETICRPDTKNHLWAALATIEAFAPATTRLAGQDGLREVLDFTTSLVERGGRSITSVEDLKNESLRLEASLLSTQASLISQLQVAPSTVYLDFCNAVIGRVMASYHDLWPAQQDHLHETLIRVLSRLSVHPTAAASATHQIVTSLLEHTLCPPLPPDIIISRSLYNEKGDWLGWRIYQSAWTSLITPKTGVEEGQEVMNHGASAAQDQDEVFHAASQLYNATIQGMLNALSALDIGYFTTAAEEAPAARENPEELMGEQTVDEDGNGGSCILAAEIGVGLAARHPENMRAFLNLAEFGCAFLEEFGSQRFRPWAYQFTLEVFQALQAHELLSGLYRLLTCAMRLSHSAGLLLAPGPEGDGSPCLELYQDIASYVLMASRRYKDELLGACLEFLLAAPSSVVQISQMGGPLKMALRLGVAFPQLACISLEALEKWEMEHPNELQAIRPQVMPLMASYMEDMAESDLPGSSKRVRGRAASAAPRSASQAQEFRELQRRIQIWVGRAGAAGHIMVEAGASTDGADSSLKANQNRWDPMRRLDLRVWWSGLQDCEPVYLDDLLPAVADLAESSTDRHVQTAACELLHALALLVIGKNAKAPCSSKEDFEEAPSDFHTIMRRFFPVMIRLATSTEGSIGRQLFHPLVIASVHWLTKNARREAAETMALLDALMDGLSDPESAARREFCAEAASEFLKWSGKHAGAGVKSQTFVHPESLLRRLFERLSHPDPYQRLGGATALYHCYRQLCQQEMKQVVDTLLLEALSQCLRALRTADGDPDGIDTVRLLTKTSLRMGTLAKKRAHELASYKADRSGPFQSLGDFLIWAWSLSNGPERDCARVSRKLLEELVPAVITSGNEGEGVSGAHQVIDCDMMEDTDQPFVVPVNLLRSWVEDLLPAAAEIEGEESSGDVQMMGKGIPSVAARMTTLPRYGRHGGSSMDMQEWLCVFVGRLHWCEWAISKGVVQVSQLKEALQEAVPRHPGPSMTLGEAVEHFLSLLFAAEPGSSGHVLGSHGKICSRAATILLQTLRTLQSSSSAEENWSSLLDKDGSRIAKLLHAAIVRPSRIGVRACEGPLQKRLAMEATAVLSKASGSGLSSTSSLLEGVKTLLAEDVRNLEESLVQSSSYPPQTTELILGLPLIVYSDLGNLLPDSFSTSSELQSRFLAFAASPVASSDPQKRQAIAQALELALHLRLGRQPELMLKELLGPNGSSLYANAPTAIHRWVVFNQSVVCDRLCNELAETINNDTKEARTRQQRAEAILLGTLKAMALTSDSRPDPRKDAFLSHMVASDGLRALQEAAMKPNSQDRIEGRLLLVRVMQLLFQIKAQLVLSPAQPGSGGVIKAILGLMVPGGDMTEASSASAKQPVQVLTEAMRLLPSLLSLSGRHQDQVRGCMKSIGDRLFVDAWELRRGTLEWNDYCSVLFQLLEVAREASVRNVGEFQVLEAAYPALRQMGQAKGHPLQAQLAKRLGMVAVAPWIRLKSASDHEETETARNQVGALLDCCWLVMRSASSQAQVSFAWMLLEYVMVPALEFAPNDQRLRLFEGCLRGIGGGTSGTFSKVASCRLIQLMFETVSYDALKVNEEFNAFGTGNPSGKGTGQIAKFLKGCLAVADPAMDQEGQRHLHSAAYCAFASLVSSSQTQMKWFSKAMDPLESSAGMAGALQNILDTDFKLPLEGLPPYQGKPQWGAGGRGPGSRGLSGPSLGTPIPTMSTMMATQEAEPGSSRSKATVGISSQLTGSQYSLGLSTQTQGGAHRAEEGGARGALAAAAASQARVTQSGASATLQTQTQTLGADSTQMLEYGRYLEALEPEGNRGQRVLEVADSLDAAPVSRSLVLLAERAMELEPSGGAGGEAHGSTAGMPDWMLSWHQALTDSTAPRLIRLLVCKLICHIENRHHRRFVTGTQGSPSDSSKSTESADDGFANAALDVGHEDGTSDTAGADEASKPLSLFGAFAIPWFTAMVDALVRDAEGEEASVLHPLLHGTLLVFLDWCRSGALHPRPGDTTATDDIRRAVKLLLERLLQVSTSTTNWKFNLKLISAAIVSFAEWAEPCPDAVARQLMSLRPLTATNSSHDKRKGRELFAIATEICSVCMEAGLVPVPNDALLDALLRVLKMDEGNNQLAASAARAVGVYLRLSESLEDPGDGRSLTRERVKSAFDSIILNGRYQGLGRFSSALESITAEFPSSARILRALVISKISLCHGETLLQILRALSRGTQGQELELMRELEPHLHLFLGQQSARLLALALLQALLPSLSDTHAQDAMAQHVVPLLSSGAGGGTSSGSGGGDDESAVSCRFACLSILTAAWDARTGLRESFLRPPLLVLLGDDNIKVRAAAVEFWDRETPRTAPSERLQSLLLSHQLDCGSSEALSLAIEASWVPSSTALLLRLIDSHPRYEASIFNEALAACSFQDRNVDTLQGGSGPGTLMSRSLFSQLSSQTQSMMMVTQDAALPAGHVRATQESSISLGTTISLSVAMPSVAWLDKGSKEGDTGATPMGGGDNSRSQHHQQRSGSGGDGAAEGGDDPFMQGRRVVLRGRKAEAQAQAAARRLKLREVQLTRKYREGELPDIESISAASIFRPLGVLCSRDRHIASCTLVAFARAITTSNQDPGHGSILEALDTVFSRKLQDPVTTATLQEIATEEHWSRGVDAGDAADAALASGSLSAGAFQVEEAIIRICRGAGAADENYGAAGADQRPRKRARAAGGASSCTPTDAEVAPPCWEDAKTALTESSWRKLAKIYGLLGQPELERLVRGSHLTSCPGLRSAQESASRGEVADAIVKYEKLLDALDDGIGGDVEELLGSEDLSEAERAACEDACLEERLSCALALGEWDHLVSQAEMDVTPEDVNGQEMEPRLLDLLGTEERRQLIPWLRGSLFNIPDNEPLFRVTDEDEEPCEGLLKCRTFWDGAKQVPGGEAVLMRLAGKEAAVLSACFGSKSPAEWDQAKSVVLAALDKLRVEWKQASPACAGRRHQVVLDMQFLADVHEALEVLRPSKNNGQQQQGHHGGSALSNLVSNWALRRPSSTHAPAEAVVCLYEGRKLLLRAIGSRSTCEAPAAELLHEAQAKVCLQGVADLREGRFWDTAQKMARDLQTKFSNQDGELKFEAAWQLAKLQLEKASQHYISSRGRSEALKHLKASLQLLPGIRTPDSGGAWMLRLRVLELEGFDCLAANQPLGSGDREALKAKALKAYSDASAAASAMASEALRSQDRGQMMIGSASLKLALFCNRQIVAEGEEEKGPDQNRGHMAAMAVRHFLVAMAQGGQKAKKAALYLPRVLNLVSCAETQWSPETAAEICGEWEAAAPLVPVGGLLPWVGQLLTVVGQNGGRAGSAVAKSLQQVAAAYPQQLYFPLHMSWPHFSTQGRRRGQPLLDALHLPVLEEFAAALNAMTYPLQRWLCHVVSIRRALNKEDRAAAERLWKAAMADCFLRSSRDDIGHAGPVNLDFARLCKAEATKADQALSRKGWDTLKLTDFDAATKPLNEVANKKGDFSRAPPSPQLSQFSKWFSSYGTSSAGGSSDDGNQSQQRQLLDMPGVREEQCLLGGVSDPGLCPKVVSFAGTTHVFKSKQKPKRLRFFGDDFQTYEYVVKGAEDVRIDDRISTLFRIMAGMLESSPEASAHRLAGSLRTFSVVPVSPVIGLLAFVPNTAPLLDAMMQGGKLRQEDLTAASSRHAAGMEKLGKGGQAYDKIYTAPDSAVSELLRECQRDVPWDALRALLLRLSGGAQGFLNTRARYTATLTAVSAAGYIAGVGDRHLQNFLIDMSTGELVAIDFGYSFGTATQVLPVPELIPFRLTRSLLGALAPAGAAVLQRPLEAALASFRADKELLEGIMDVFLAEPLQEWQREGEILSKQQSGRRSSGGAKQELGASREEAAASDHIALKVKHAAAKLEGQAPAKVLLEELEARHGQKTCWSSMKRIVKGDPHASACSSGPLTPADQARCLLELATSPAILGRTWQGWRPWL